MKDSRTSWVDSVLVPATSRYVFAWQVIAFIALMSAVLQIFASMDLGTDDLPLRMLIAVLAVAPTFVVIALAHQIRFVSTTLKAIIILVSYAVGGMLRGAFIAGMLNITGLLVGGGWQFRLPSSAGSLGMALAITVYGWSTYSEHRIAASRLLEETRQLSDALAQLEAGTEATAIEQVTEVSTSLVRDLEAVALQPVHEQVREIQSIIDDKVRPLSRELASTIHRWVPHIKPGASPRLREVWAQTDPFEHLPSFWVAASFVLTAMPSALYFFGWRHALDLAWWTGLLLYLTQRITYPVVRRVLPKVRSPWRELLITIAFEFLALPIGAVSYLLLLDTQHPRTYLSITVISFPVYAWLVLLGNTFWRDAKLREERLLEVREDLRWAIARVNMLAWFNRGVIARLLHGPIQNAMHATVLRLRDQDPSAVIDGVIRELQTRIADVEPLLRDRERPTRAIEEEFAGIAEIWTGLAAVTISAAPEALAALREDGPGTAIVLDLCQEATSNAIRHGSATEVELSLTSAGRTLELGVRDNGRKRVPSVSVGVGTQFLETCSMGWSYRRDDGTNTLTVTIPVTQELSTAP